MATKYFSPAPGMNSRRTLSAASLVLATTLGSFALAQTSFTGAASDTSAYVAFGHMWSTSSLSRPVGTHLLPLLATDAAAFSPLGFRRGVTPGTEVPAYPAGWPLLLATMERLTRDSLGAFVVTPAMYALLALATFWLAADAAGLLGGVAAALLTTLLPITFYHAVHPMSDVAAAALWMTAWHNSRRLTASAAAASGLASALAILVRPNLAPLALVPFTLLGLAGARRRTPALPLLYGGLAFSGAVLQFIIQAVLYGSPFNSSYVGAQQFFSLDQIPANVVNYSAMTYDHIGGIAIVLSALSVIAAIALSRGRDRELVLGGIGIAVLNVSLYIAYLPFTHWPFLRFFLPAIASLAVVSVVGWTCVFNCCGASWTRAIAIGLACCQLSFGALHRPDLWKYAWNDWRDQQRILLMGRYLRHALPSNVIILGFIHTGALADYTGFNTVRLDLIAPERLEPLVDSLKAHGYAPALVLDGQLETTQFTQRFGSTKLGALNWAPRARFVGVHEASYWLSSDAAPDSPPYSTDVLRSLQ